MIRKLCLTLAVITAASFSFVSAQQTAKVTASGIGYLEYLPQGYHSNSNKYPLVISLHGIKEKGANTNDRKRIIADLAKVDNVGLPKYVKSGKQYPFILISPQLKNNLGVWPADYVMEVVNYVRKTLRVDEQRIYLTGLSLGGFGVWRTAGEYPDVFAAILPVCAGGNSMKKANDIAAKNLPVWGFHGGSDKVVSYTVTTKMVNAINAAPKKPNPLAKATIFPGMGHIIWDKAYNQTNSLDWLLSHRKGSAPPKVDPGKDDNKSGDKGGKKDDGKKDNDKKDDSKKDNKNSGKNGNKNNGGKKQPAKKNSIPFVTAGPDRVVNLPTNAITIQGKASDKDGKIVSYLWQKTYGNPVTFSGAGTPTVRISNLKKGVYIFRLRAKDNSGAIKDDYFKITVNEPRTSSGNTGKKNNNTSSGRKSTGKKNQAPYAYAGPDRVISLPQNALTIQSKASDRDGRIVSYQWTKTYGNNRVRLNGAKTPSVHLSNLAAGVYIFRLSVKDNDGAVKNDYFKITVKDKRTARRK